MKPKKIANYLLPTRDPTTSDIAWAAGIVEGEGHFSANHGGYSTYVVVDQKERWILDKLRDLFGGSVYWEPHGGFPLHRWYIGGTIARGFIYTVFTFLSPHRKAKCKKALGGI